MEQETKQSKNNGRGGPVKRSIAGGILGATVGYFATPENGKKLIARVDKEALKNKSVDFGRAAKEKSSLAFQNLKSSTSNFLKRDGYDDSAETQVSATAEVETDELQDLKDENQKLQDRLKSLEEKMNQLSEAAEIEDDEEEDEEEETANTKKKASNKKKANTKNTKDQDDEEDTDEEDDTTAKQKKETKKSNGKKKASAKKSDKDEEEDEDTSLTSEDDTSA